MKEVIQNKPKIMEVVERDGFQMRGSGNGSIQRTLP